MHLEHHSEQKLTRLLPSKRQTVCGCLNRIRQAVRSSSKTIHQTARSYRKHYVAVESSTHPSARPPRCACRPQSWPQTACGTQLIASEHIGAHRSYRVPHNSGCKQADAHLPAAACQSRCAVAPQADSCSSVPHSQGADRHALPCPHLHFKKHPSFHSRSGPSRGSSHHEWGSPQPQRWEHP